MGMSRIKCRLCFKKKQAKKSIFVPKIALRVEGRQQIFYRVWFTLNYYCYWNGVTAQSLVAIVSESRDADDHFVKCIKVQSPRKKSVNKTTELRRCNLKGAQVWDFRPIFFYINKSYMSRWLEDWRQKKKLSKTTADIRHFVFFTQAEPALKICLRRLSLR